MMQSLKQLVTHSGFRVGLQLGTGQFIIALVVFIRNPFSGIAWVGSINHPAVSMLLSQNPHTGTQLLAAANMAGDLVVGTILGAVCIAMAGLPGFAFATWLGIFTASFLVLPAVARAKLPSNGMMATLGFAIAVVIGQPSATHDFWGEIAGKLSFVNFLAGAAAAVSTIVVLPSRAVPDLERRAGNILQDLGVGISTCSDLICGPTGDPSAPQPGQGAPVPQALQTQQPEQQAAQRGDPEEEADAGSQAFDRFISASTQDVAPSAEVIREALLQRTDPKIFREDGQTHPERSAPMLRAIVPQIQQARRLVASIPLDFPAAANQQQRSAAWLAALDALDLVCLRTAALDVVLEGEAPLLSHADLLHFMSRIGVLPAFQQVFGQMAKACHSLGLTLTAQADSKRGGQGSAGPGRQHNSSPLRQLHTNWPAMEHQVATVVQSAVQSYWRWWRSDDFQHMHGPEYQTRALLYMTALSNSLLEAVATAEDAITQVIALHYSAGPSAEHAGPAAKRAGAAMGFASSQAPPADQSVPLTGKGTLGSLSEEDASPETGIRQRSRRRLRPSEGQEAAQSGDVSVGDEEPLIASAGGLLQVPVEQRPFKQWLERETVENRSSQRELRISIGNALCGGAAQKQRLTAQLRAWGPYLGAQLWWVWRLAKGIVAWHLWVMWAQAGVEAARHVRHPKEWRTTLRSRTFQYGLKYYAMNAALLTLIIALQANVNLTSWHPVFVAATFNVIISEKINVTISKGVLRFLGSVVGAVVGFLAMLNTATATNPYVLSIVLFVFAWLCGLLNYTKWKYAAFLALYTDAVLILAQYSPEAGAHGRAQYLGARMADISMAIAACMVLSLLQPWFADHEALAGIGAVAAAAGRLNQQLYHQFYHELQRPLGESGWGAAEQAADSQALQETEGRLMQCVGAPLGAVQASVSTAIVPWRRGLLVMPALVQEGLAAMQVMVERLAAVEAVLLQPPIVSGRFTSAPFLHLGQPVHPQNSACMSTVAQLMRDVAAVLSAPETGQSVESALRSLEASIEANVEARVAFRSQYYSVRTMDHAAARTEDNSSWLKERTLDDAVRFLAFVFASSRSCDTALLLARMVADDQHLKKHSVKRWGMLIC
eukprot:jgi/Astpho2/5375/fgenesh1_pg.00075_%23_46_t